jgi:hypothetical protein
LIVHIPDGRAGALYVAAVHAVNGVRFAAVAESRHVLIRQVAAYVQRRSADALWLDHARHVRTLVAREDLEAAVELYFDLVGDRWDKEWLVTTVVVSTDDRPDLPSATPDSAPSVSPELAERP